MKNKKNNNALKNIFIKDWDCGQVNVKRINFGSWNFFSFYEREKIFKRYLWSAIFGLWIGITSFFFLQKTGIYNLGATGFFQGLSRLAFFGLTYFHNYTTEQAEVFYNILFWTMNLLFNIPLAIFGYFKIGKQFSFLSIINIAASSIIGLILGAIPALKDFYIFTNPLTNNQSLINNNIQVLEWSGANDTSKIIILLIYGIVLGVLGSISTTFIYIMGGSTGGTDWLLFYHSKKNISLFGTTSLIINLIITIISFIIGTYIPYSIVLNNAINTSLLVANFFSPILIATLLSVMLRKMITKKFYPQFDVVTIKIYTDKIDLIRALFIKQKLVHAFTLNRSTGGYSLKPHPNIEMVCFYREVPEVISMVRKHDQDCLIISSPVISVQGNFRIRSDFD
ncbi:YitT family protein, DUF2179 domain-containing protein [[Mycoplasma] cavipharyngis]|uniref:YitT family protein n=1 Tax=[Mycoplasma] cavipharyngis TaxID=92757 RepID=UPI003703E14D